MKPEEMLSSQLMRIINKLIFTGKKSLLEYKGTKLYPSEIHLMRLISAEADLNATEMADKLGITKGAVSQTLSRLESKGILVKTKDPYLKNKLSVDFTAFGKEILAHHQRKTEALGQEYETYLSFIPEEERRIIQRFLGSVEVFIDRLG